MSIIRKFFVLYFLLAMGPLVVLAIGVQSRNRKITLEGTAYSLAYVAPSILFTSLDIALFQAASVVLAIVLVVAMVRVFQLRPLWPDWANREAARWRRVESIPDDSAAAPPSERPGQVSVPSLQSDAAPSSAVDDLSSALAWVSATAKSNKYRLPAEAYVSILETCQTLGTIVEAESMRPSHDASFEYELDAIVRQYLPAVLSGYLNVPAGVVGERQPNGRTADEEFIEQLGLLAGQAESLHSSRHGQASAELSSTGNFLRERFGQRGAKFDFGVH